jgi:predicted esterase
MKRGVFFILSILLSISSLFGGIKEDVLKLIHSTDPEEQDILISNIVKKDPRADQITLLIKNITFPEPKKRGIVTLENRCIDGITRPFCLYIPESYDPSKKTPLLVYLHGGVSRKEIIENPGEYVKESPFIPLSDDEGYILLFPFGQGEATWWDSVGVENIKAQVRIVKRDFNIDDNRVFMTGFSDGGSGSFFFAMCHPTDFAAFLPLNGHPGVGSLDGGIQTYLVNLFNHPLSVINTDEDPLYPHEKMYPIMKLAIEAGADLSYRIYKGIGHTFEYAPLEIPNMKIFMETHPREMHPTKIIWESVKRRHGRCMWLSVDSVAMESIPNWYEDHNLELIDERIAFGFYPDDTYEGPGIRMEKVVDSTFAYFVGAKDGDIIIKVKDDSVTSMDVLNEYKSSKKRGDPAEITVLRKGDKLILKGHFPPPQKYTLFRRENPSGRAEVLFHENRYFVRGSRLGSFTLFIHPDMVRSDKNVQVFLNGTLCHDKRITPDIDFMLRTFLETRDREMLYINKITVKK